MKILLTGSTGYIGSAVYKCLKEQHEVYSIVRKSNNNDNNSIVWDFRNNIAIDFLPKQLDVILHLAQSKLYREFPENAMDMFTVNVASTASLLDYAVKAGVKQFILMSSGTVYEPYQGNFLESTLQSPNGYYATSKYMSELLTKCYADRFKICILRAFFVYGPHQTDRLIPDLISRIRNGLPITLKSGKDGMILTPTYIDDVVDIVNTAIESTWEGTINLASSDEAVSIRKIAEVIARILNKPSIFQEAEQHLQGTYEQLCLVPELNNLLKQYSRPFVSLEEGLRRTLSVNPVLKIENEV